MAHMLSQLIKKKLPEWNECVFSVDDLPEMCARLKCGYLLAPIRAKGEYIQHGEFPFVIVQEGLKRPMKSWVGTHEVGHHILHYPSEHKFSRSTFSKADREANFFAAIALMPTWMCHAMTPDEIIAEYDYPKQIVEIRLEISQFMNI